MKHGLFISQLCVLGVMSPGSGQVVSDLGLAPVGPSQFGDHLSSNCCPGRQLGDPSCAGHPIVHDQHFVEAS